MMFHLGSSKKIKMKRIFLFLIVLSIQFSTAQQQQDLQRANRFFEKTYYSEAIPLYEKVMVSKPSLELRKNLGDCYFFTNNYANAKAQYAYVVNSKDKTIGEEYYYRYAQTLKASGKYEEAVQVLKDYYVASDNKEALDKLNNDIKTLKNISAIGERFEIKNLAINTVNSEFGGVVFGDNLVYAAAKKNPNVFDKIYRWNNESYLNLVSAPLKNVTVNDSLVRYFSNSLKSSRHESNAVFTKDGKTMYYTRNGLDKSKNADKIATIQIFKAKFVNDKWTNPVALPFNSPTYSVEHPALSPDEKTLYFASDMPGTLGSFDIFSVSIDGENYGKPVNLGDKINTPKREQFPFVASDNKLYFSSNGKEGYGGLDVFVSELVGNSFADASNVGLPLNSNYDDFSFYIDAETKEGFFSSNRLGGKGKDDIYSIKETKDLIIEDCKQYIKGVITDVDTHLALANAVVVLKDASNQEVDKVTTTAEGLFSFNVACETNYTAFVSKENYTDNNKKVIVSPDRDKSNEASMAIRSMESIQKEEQLALEKKKAAEMLLAEQMKAKELAAIEAKKKADEQAIIAQNQRKKEEAIALEAKRLAELAVIQKAKADKIEADKKAAELAEANKKARTEAIVKTEKDIVKENNRLLIKTDPIYFDYNMWYIRKESKRILNRVVELMNKYPEMKVEIGSHTDNRGNARYNADLSQKRADATRDYMVEQGISSKRIISKGYGAAVPIIRCVPAESCDEEQHELNRRSEFVIKNL